MTTHRVVSTTLLASLSLTALAAPAASAAATDPWVRTWGANAVGQLGNATTTTQPTPGDVTGLARTDVRKLSGGGDDKNAFALALLADGTVKSWGANASGQLGNGTTTNQSVPTTVAGLSGISAADAGSDHGLAVRKGRVHAWGSNAKGQLGNGLTEDDKTGMKKTPVVVQALDEVKDVGAGCQFSVALRQDGTVWTWGDGSKGRLGTGPGKDDETANDSRNTPQQIKDLTDIAAISVGCSHVLALTVDGNVKAWGEGTNGMLGNDAVANALAPVDVKLLKGVKSVSAGTYNSFAILNEGEVKAWGKNDFGQLGDGTTTSRTTPVPIDKLKGTKSIIGGVDFTLAAQPDGSVLTLGNNDAFQLGDGTNTATTATTDHAPATALPSNSGITRVAVTTSGKSAYAY
ncbi:RCC1 domain-containing protein [Streptomyces exfoliatus]|uniref:RCC1 domain-containing protein n=1 Tax=Streptomyces exfoliatus TaxID=1905 RepID=UPI003C2BCB20